MSQSAISAGSIAWPRFGPSASANGKSSTLASTAPASTLRVDMLHLATRLHAPTRGAVVVLARETRDPWDCLGLAAHGHDLLPSRLRVARVVPGLALQYG